MGGFSVINLIFKIELRLFIFSVSWVSFGSVCCFQGICQCLQSIIFSDIKLFGMFPYCPCTVVVQLVVSSTSFLMLIRFCCCMVIFFVCNLSSIFLFAVQVNLS